MLVMPPDWKTRVKEDLRPFAEPGQEIAWSDQGLRLVGEWDSHGRALVATFTPSPKNTIDVSFEGETRAYRSFLAHPLLGDLLALAKMIQQAYKPELYVPTKAAERPASDATSIDLRPAEASSLLHQLAAGHDDATTRILFVAAEAGAGKTHVFRELVRTQAARFLRGEARFLYLYINAQGRALARFDEALAVELQDLRARLTYHAIPALTRNGLLVPVVDGFDELLGVAGYDDAFASLQRFIDELQGAGQLVASARSVYYEQEFLQRASRVPQAWTVLPIDVLQWGDDEFNDFVSRRFAWEANPRVDEATFKSGMRDVFSRPENREFRKKPLFVSRVASLLLQGEEFPSGRHLIEQLIVGYLERERSEKLLDSKRTPILSSEQLHSLFSLLSDEMWTQQTRELDAKSTRDVAEVYLSTIDIPQTAKEAVIQRMPTLAFLGPGRGPNRVAFEHELYFAYFLAMNVFEAVSESDETLRIAFLRGSLPPDCVRFAAKRLKLGGVDLSSLLARVTRICEGQLIRASQVRENGGSLITACLHSYFGEVAVERLTFRNLIFAGESFSGLIMKEDRFERVEFRRSDLTATRFERCSATETVMLEPLVDPNTTTLEIFGLSPSTDIVGIRVAGSSNALYSPDEMRPILVMLGLPSIETLDEGRRSIDPEVVKLVDRIAGAFERANVVWPGDDKYRNLVQDSRWVAIRRLLLETEIVTEETRASKGASRDALRRNYPPETVLAGASRFARVPTAIQSFWDRLEQMFHNADSRE
jgi:hypothetical protein